MSTNDTPVESPIEGHIGEETTIATLRDALETNDYTGAEIEQAIEAEEHRPQNDDGPRTGAMDLLSEAFDEATSGPNYDTEDVDAEQAADRIAAATTDGPTETTTAMKVADEDVDDDQQVRVARAVGGMGATESGQPGIVLPSPYADDAPDTVRVFTPVVASIGRESTPYDVGAHDVPYTMQVKNQLETETNRLRLSQADPLHPANGDDEE